MSQEKHYEMLWDCQYCGTQKLLGKTHSHCPTCGGAQDPDARYFPTDDEKVAVEDHELVGNDIECPACGSQNSSKAKHCGTCGAPLEKGEAARQIKGGKWIAQDADSKYNQSRDVAQEKFEREMAAAGVDLDGEKKTGGTRRIIMLAVVAVGILACGVLVWMFTQTEAQTVVASQHEWVRTINVETYQRTQDGDWRDAVPAAAYNEDCYEKQDGTERVQVGETCRTERRDNGDGTFTEREVCEPDYENQPVYDTWCDYDIDRWTEAPNITTNGTLDDPLSWGETDFRCSGPQRGCSREAGRDENYTVIFDADGETYRCGFSLDEWQGIEPGSRWQIEVRQLGGAVCDSLTPQ